VIVFRAFRGYPKIRLIRSIRWPNRWRTNTILFCNLCFSISKVFWKIKNYFRKVINTLSRDELWKSIFARHFSWL